MTSLIIYTHNSEKYIGRLLESIMEQMDETKYELIIVDDLSTDNTIPIIVQTIGYFFTDEEHYKLYINSYPKGKRKSIEMAKNIAKGDFKFIINKKKRINIGGKDDTVK